MVWALAGKVAQFSRPNRHSHQGRNRQGGCPDQKTVIKSYHGLDWAAWSQTRNPDWQFGWENGSSVVKLLP